MYMSFEWVRVYFLKMYLEFDAWIRCPFLQRMNKLLTDWILIDGISNNTCMDYTLAKNISDKTKYEV